MDGRCIGWPQQGGRRLGSTGSPRPTREDRALLAQRQVGIVNDVAGMGEGARRIEQRVEIEWTVVAPVTRHGSPREFLARAFARPSRIFLNVSSGGDDLVGIAETFKCLRKELLRRA
jgi:hypothetical protein